jgi:hypothetical protein
MKRYVNILFIDGPRRILTLKGSKPIVRVNNMRREEHLRKYFYKQALKRKAYTKYTY